MSMTAVRKASVNQILQNFPDLNVIEGVPPAGFTHATRSYCFIYPGDERQEPNNLIVRRRIVIEVLLPYVQRMDSDTAVAVDPETIETLVDEMKDSLKEIQTGDGYVSLRHLRTSYPGDPSGQKTRAYIEFESIEESLWY